MADLSTINVAEMEAGPEADTLIAEVFNVPSAPYSTDIGVVWPLAERLGVVVIPIKGGWVASHDGEHGYTWEYINDGLGYCEYNLAGWEVAPTAPLAICKALIVPIQNLIRVWHTTEATIAVLDKNWDGKPPALKAAATRG